MSEIYLNIKSKVAIKDPRAMQTYFTLQCQRFEFTLCQSFKMSILWFRPTIKCIQNDKSFINSQYIFSYAIAIAVHRYSHTLYTPWLFICAVLFLSNLFLNKTHEQIMTFLLSDFCVVPLSKQQSNMTKTRNTNMANIILNISKLTW